MRSFEVFLWQGAGEKATLKKDAALAFVNQFLSWAGHPVKKKPFPPDSGGGNGGFLRNNRSGDGDEAVAFFFYILYTDLDGFPHIVRHAVILANEAERAQGSEILHEAGTEGGTACQRKGVLQRLLGSVFQLGPNGFDLFPTIVSCRCFRQNLCESHRHTPFSKTVELIYRYVKEGRKSRDFLPSGLGFSEEDLQTFFLTSVIPSPSCYPKSLLFVIPSGARDL